MQRRAICHSLSYPFGTSLFLNLAPAVLSNPPVSASQYAGVPGALYLLLALPSHPWELESLGLHTCRQ